MKNLTATNRLFENVENGYKYRLHTSNDASQYHLILEDDNNEASKGTEVNGFYTCPFTDVTIKINNSKQIKLTTSQFYNLKEGEKITHKKFIGFKKFTKI